MRSFAAEEEYGLHAVSLHGAMFEAQWWVPAFARWSEQRDLTAVYKEFHELLQLLRWRRKEPASNVQILKAPQFMQDIRAVLSEFPDARIIRLERDLSQVVASSASLVWHQQRIQSDHADRIRIGAEWQRKTALREERAGAGLLYHPRSSIMTLDYEATNRNWKGEIGRVYDFLGLKAEKSIIRKMERTFRETSHQGHDYSAQDFGLGASCTSQASPTPRNQRRTA